MRILSVAYPLLPVGPGSAGGAEQILYLLERGLVQAGHQSVVVGARGSEVSGELIATSAATGEIDEKRRSLAQRDHLRAIESALDRYEMDVVHFHGLDFFTYLPDRPIAKFATLHLPGSWYPSAIFDDSRCRLNCVSNSQAEAAPSKIRLPVVANAIDVEKYSARTAEGKHLLWIGRICPEKGVHIALEVAHRAGLPAIVAGPVHPFRDHQSYFSECVQPLLDRERQYVGPVGLEQKARLLGEAIGLLVPSLVPETSSLVAMEAAAAGTPVIAYRKGALPEVVEHGVTGFIVDSQDEMLAAATRVGEISAERCQQRARERFDSRRMVDDYLRLYGHS